MAVELEYVVPPADLQPFVTLFYRFRCADPLFDDRERAQIAQLRFRLTPGKSSYHFPDGSEQAAAPFHLLGPTTGPTRVRAEGPLLVFGIGLTPAGWQALLGGDASAMANRVVDAGALFGAEVSQAAMVLRRDGGAAAMAAAIEPLMRRLFGSGHASTLAFMRAVDDWLTGSPSPELETLIAATGLSRRQAERRCNALYGAPPKLLARRYRALRAAVALASGAVVVEGFYDQSHLIREVKQFTGLTPRRLREDPGALTKLTIMQRGAMAGQVPHRVVSET